MSFAFTSCVQSRAALRRRKRSIRASRATRATQVEPLEDRRLLSVTNGSFEGGLAGWTTEVPVDGFAQTVSSYTSQPSGAIVYGPRHGDAFAQMKTDGARSYTTVTQPVEVVAGDKVSGWAFFDTTDYSPFADNAQVYIRQADGAGPVIATVFDESVASVGSYGETSWRFWEYTFPEAARLPSRRG